MTSDDVFYIGMALLTMISIFVAIIIFSDDEPPHEKKSRHPKTKHKAAHRHAH